MDAHRVIAPRRLVLGDGWVAVRAQPGQTTVVWLGTEEPVDFLKPGLSLLRGTQNGS
jgi:hypothetical protein